MNDPKKPQISEEAYRASKHFTHAGFVPSNADLPVTPRAEHALNKSNQLFRELLSVNSLDPFVQHSTSPRKQMFASQVSQSLVVHGSTPRSIQTGMEREYAKYTFNIKSPGDVKILRVIERYPKTHDLDSIPMNPQTIAVYEDAHTKEVGFIDIVNYASNHQYFGFKYRNGPGMRKLYQGADIAEGEVFRESPSVTENGDYKYGIEANVAHMTIPGTSEDGYYVSKSMAKRMTYSTYESRSTEINDRVYPINAYGNNDVYKICPDVGERVRDDGLLMALRPYNLDSAVYDQSPHGLQEFQYGFDRPIYVPPGGRVVDIQVVHDTHNYQRRVLAGMDQQLQKYQNATIKFYKEIISVYRHLKRIRKESLVLTPAFNQLVVKAMLFTDESDNARTRLSYRNARIEDWRIEFTIEYDNEPGIGFKISGCHGLDLNFPG